MNKPNFFECYLLHNISWGSKTYSPFRLAGPERCGADNLKDNASQAGGVTVTDEL